MVERIKAASESWVLARSALRQVIMLAAKAKNAGSYSTGRWVTPAAVMVGVAIATATGPAQPLPEIDPSSFRVKSYGGKCLDYGQRQHEPRPSGPGPTGYRNDCALAHPLHVEEINDRHEVVLHAGTKVLGISRSPTVSPTDFPLELQNPGDRALSDRDQVFALDGDSIILASSRPCINTDRGGVRVVGWVSLPGDPPALCPPPPPELVVRIQNARGANGSPIVVGPRHLEDSEFWDFERMFPVGRGRTGPTTGFKSIAKSDDLWNAVCASPKVRLVSPDVPVIHHPGSADDGQPLVGPCSDLMIGWGAVIMVSSPADCPHKPGPSPGLFTDIGPCLDLSNYPPILLPAGITVRGDRRSTNLGPQLYFSFQQGRWNGPTKCGSDSCALEVRGDYVRVNGLRMRGENRSTAITPATVAIGVGYVGDATVGPPFGVSTSTEHIATIDHNDLSDWGEAAVVAFGPYGLDPDHQLCTVKFNGEDFTQACGCTLADPRRPSVKEPIANDRETLANVHIARNFLHHNERDGGGYGVAVGRAFIEGNTFVSNRHAITAGGEPHNEYRAWNNLVLSSAPRYGSSPHKYFNQDFDMHGTNDPGHWFGGQGGYRVEIIGNTFLGTNRFNYELRGVPCLDTQFSDNISVQKKVYSIRSKFSRIPIPGDTRHIISSSNPQQFERPDETDRLRVGDFDGDGREDLFLATGAAWYYSPGAQAEWRFLSAKKETVNHLLFGDFDADGRTDVFTQIDQDWMVSWAGISAWERVNRSQWPMTDFYVGDFVGDSRDDVFFARGDQWFVSNGVRDPFVPYATSSLKLPDLAFGHFDIERKYGDNEKLDVVGVVMDEQGRRKWMVVYARAPVHQWEPLRAAQTNTMNGLIVADFGRTGFSDIVRVTRRGMGGSLWRISRLGRSAFTDFTFIPITTPAAVVGRFDEAKMTDRRGADILVWDHEAIKILVSGTGAPQSHSRQDMR
jgi:hypothetical protein